MLFLRSALAVFAMVLVTDCASVEPARVAWSSSDAPPPAVIVSWSSNDSERDEAGFFPLLDTRHFEDMWSELVARDRSSRFPVDRWRPKVDFAKCVGFAIAAGRTWNSRGYAVQSIERVGAEWHVRLAQETYQSVDSADNVQPYGIFLLTRIPGSEIVVDEDVRDLINAPPQWKERGRLSVPKLAAASGSGGDRPALALVSEADLAGFEAQVLDAVRAYETYPRVSDVPAWSPYFCRMPPTPGALASHADGDAAHARKLYHLFAKDEASYRGRDHQQIDAHPLAPLAPAPPGQVLVKEAWKPERIEHAPVDATTGGLPSEVATLDGALYRRGELHGLFVMLKLDPATPGTDAGWVYATVTPDRSRVTAAGRVESCMRCHVDAPHDRQFGLPVDWEAMRRPPGH